MLYFYIHSKVHILQDNAHLFRKYLSQWNRYVATDDDTPINSKSYKVVLGSGLCKLLKAIKLFVSHPGSAQDCCHKLKEQFVNKCAETPAYLDRVA